LKPIKREETDEIFERYTKGEFVMDKPRFWQAVNQLRINNTKAKRKFAISDLVKNIFSIKTDNPKYKEYPYAVVDDDGGLDIALVKSKSVARIFIEMLNSNRLEKQVTTKLAEEDCVKVWRIAQDGEYGAWQYCHKNSQGGAKDKKEALYQASFFDKPIIVVDNFEGVIESKFSR
jgi:hypothetical protein